MSAERLLTRQKEIKSLADQGYQVKELNDGYCYRINGIYDLYPVNNKYHHIPSGKRGAVENLKTFLLKTLSFADLPKPAELKLPNSSSAPFIAKPTTTEEEDILTGKKCWYCNNPTKFVSSRVVYDKDYGMNYLCEPCDAYVGVHENTTIGKGRVANAELRQWKRDAHAKFDKIWKAKIRLENCSKKKARDFAYRWLSQQMGLTFGQCHIGWMKVEECQQVIAICDRASMEEVLSGKEEPQKPGDGELVNECPFE